MSIQLLLAQVLLLVLGLLGVAAARPDLIMDHGVKALLALGATFIFARMQPRTFMKHGTTFWLVTLVLLLLVLFIGVGTAESEGTRRWLKIGSQKFQPSELAKLGLILQLASFFSRRGVQNKLLSATAMIVVTTALIIVEPDLGTSVLTFSLGIVLMFAAGVRISNIAGFMLALGLLSLPLIGRYVETHPYILERFTGHVTHGDVPKPGMDQIDLVHRDLMYGGWWGHGPDGLRFQYFAAHTDMVVAAVGFSTGLLGVIMMLFAYWLIVATSLQVAQLAARIRPMSPEIHGASILATGCMYMVVGQAFVNLLVAARIFPVTGVPLPLVSYGFSSMLTMSVALGIIHSCMRTVREQLPDEAANPDLLAVPAD